MRKYLQSLDFGDSAVGLHIDLSKYKGMDISILKLSAHRITGFLNVGVDTLDYLVQTGINFWKLTTLGLDNIRPSDLDKHVRSSDDLDILEQFLDQCKAPLETLILTSCELTEEFILTRTKKFSSLEVLLLESDLMKEAALTQILSLSCRTLRKFRIFDMRVGMSFERIANKLECLDLQEFKLFSQISVVSGLMNFISKSSHSLHYLSLESHHQKDNSAPLTQPLAFPRLRTLNIGNTGITRIPVLNNLNNLTSLTIESDELLRTHGLANILKRCSHSLRKLELLELANGVDIVPDCEMEFLNTLKIDTMSRRLRKSMGDQVLKLMSKCPSLETLILKGDGIIDFNCLDDMKLKPTNLKFLVLEAIQGVQGHAIADLSNLSKFLATCSSSLLELNLIGNLDQLNLDTDLTSLRSLKVRGDEQPGESLVTLLTRCGSSLRSLDLGFHMMDLTGLQLLENGLPELRKLNLRSQNQRRSVPGLVELLDMVATSLQSLNLTYIRLQDMESLSHDLPMLKHVSVYPKALPEDLQPLLARCPSDVAVK